MSDCHVLVVEDEPLLAMDLADALGAMGLLTVGPVGQLARALELVATERIDCAVLDVNIRGGTSIPIALALVARDVPVIFTTGYSTPALPIELRKLPRFTKPYDLAAVVDRIRHLCR